MSHPVPIGIPVGELRPTQMTVGLREVEAKRRQWRGADKDIRAKLLRRHVLPAVVGPKGRRYIVDHHHFARALLEEDAGLIAVYVVADLGRLSKHAFWTFLDNSSWCHAYDADGRRRDLADIPKHLGDLADDPYRSLAGALIRSGSCAKSSKPFAEFLWADYLPPQYRRPCSTRIGRMQSQRRSWWRTAKTPTACRDGAASIVWGSRRACSSQGG